MRKLSGLPAICLAAAMIPGLCACSAGTADTSDTTVLTPADTTATAEPTEDAEDASADITETTEQSQEDEEPTTDNTEDASTEAAQEAAESQWQTVHVDLGTVMGFEDCYAEGEVCERFTIWTVYNSSGEEIGCQFPTRERPGIVLEDLDGDGIDEMICPLQYDADGGCDVFIYRNNGGVVERGRCSLWHGRTNLDSDLIYDEETDQIIFIYMDGESDRETPVTIDDFEFEEYIPG